MDVADGSVVAGTTSTLGVVLAVDERTRRADERFGADDAAAVVDEVVACEARVEARVRRTERAPVDVSSESSSSESVMTIVRVDVARRVRGADAGEAAEADACGGTRTSSVCCLSHT